MPTIAVASDNPTKTQAALLGFQRMFPTQQFEVAGVAVDSGVSAQPTTEMCSISGVSSVIIVPGSGEALWRT